MLLVCFTLIGCQTKKDVLKFNVDNIYFITGKNTYELKDEKHKEILDYLESLESIQWEVTSDIDDFWGIQIDEEKIYLNKDGTFVYQNKLYKPENKTLVEMYTNALGGDIFKGAIFANDEWIKDVDKIQQIFSININKVEQVTFVPDYKIDYQLKKEKLETFIQAMNDTKTFPYIEYISDGLFGRGIHNIYVNQGDQILAFELYDDGKEAFILMYVKPLNLYNKAEWVYIYLSDPEISSIYKEMFGEKYSYILSDENVKLEINDEWLEAME